VAAPRRRAGSPGHRTRARSSSSLLRHRHPEVQRRGCFHLLIELASGRADQHGPITKSPPCLPPSQASCSAHKRRYFRYTNGEPSSRCLSSGEQHLAPGQRLPSYARLKVRRHAVNRAPQATSLTQGQSTIESPIPALAARLPRTIRPQAARPIGRLPTPHHSDSSSPTWRRISLRGRAPGSRGQLIQSAPVSALLGHNPPSPFDLPLAKEENEFAIRDSPAQCIRSCGTSRLLWRHGSYLNRSPGRGPERPKHLLGLPAHPDPFSASTSPKAPTFRPKCRAACGPRP